MELLGTMDYERRQKLGGHVLELCESNQSMIINTWYKQQKRKIYISGYISV